MTRFASAEAPRGTTGLLLPFDRQGVARTDDRQVPRRCAASCSRLYLARLLCAQVNPTSAASALTAEQRRARAARERAVRRLDYLPQQGRPVAPPWCSSRISEAGSEACDGAGERTNAHRCASISPPPTARRGRPGGTGRWRGGLTQNPCAVRRQRRGVGSEAHQRVGSLWPQRSAHAGSRRRLAIPTDRGCEAGDPSKTLGERCAWADPARMSARKR